MNELMQIHGGSAVTMTSLEMVEFINSQRGDDGAVLAHSDFLKKVPLVLGEVGAGSFSFTYRDTQNKERPCYRFPKREACLMAMSYSYDLQAKVFDRMTALEARPIDPMQILSDPAAMRGLLLTYTEKVLALESKVAEDAPKVAALERIALSDGLLNLQAAGKVLQQPPNKFIQWLRENGWIFRRPGNKNNCPYEDKRRSGYMALKATTVTYPDGTDRTFEQAMVTPKGLTKLAKMLGASVDGELFGGELT